jgi:hypothetical protein
LENPYSDFPENYSSVDMMEVAQELICRLDLAVQKDLSVDEAYAKCIEPIPAPLQMLLKSQPLETIQHTVMDKTPDHWALNSAAGEELIQKLYEKLTA